VAIRRFAGLAALAAGGVLAALACTGAPPELARGPGGGLPPCPASPNCVSSETTDESHRVAPFDLAVDPTAGWLAAREAVLELPRTRIVRETPGYLHAECRSALWRFVDDLELELHPAQARIAVRSASRVGYGDMGVNRRRVESLRSALRARGVLGTE
jgi:uncharacterized protein (DUF1499 family)